MKFIAGLVLGFVISAGFVWAQNNEDYLGRPQFGKKIYPKQDALGVPVIPQSKGDPERFIHRSPC